ncbi:MAG: hypothetical protein KA472_11360 [Pseudomonadales bacterium]|nr:hypothetical protein [Pseudomonadales bacterium]
MKKKVMGPYSWKVFEKRQRLRGLRVAAEKQRVADISTAWAMAQEGKGWEDIAAACHLSTHTARRLVGLSTGGRHGTA